MEIVRDGVAEEVVTTEQSEQSPGYRERPRRQDGGAAGKQQTLFWSKMEGWMTQKVAPAGAGLQQRDDAATKKVM